MLRFVWCGGNGSCGGYNMRMMLDPPAKHDRIVCTQFFFSFIIIFLFLSWCTCTSCSYYRIVWKSSTRVVEHNIIRWLDGIWDRKIGTDCKTTVFIPLLELETFQISFPSEQRIVRNFPGHLFLSFASFHFDGCLALARLQNITSHLRMKISNEMIDFSSTSTPSPHHFFAVYNVSYIFFPHIHCYYQAINHLLISSLPNIPTTSRHHHTSFRILYLICVTLINIKTWPLKWMNESVWYQKLVEATEEKKKEAKSVWSTALLLTFHINSQLQHIASRKHFLNVIVQIKEAIVSAVRFFSKHSRPTSILPLSFWLFIQGTFFSNALILHVPTFIHEHKYTHMKWSVSL